MASFDENSLQMNIKKYQEKRLRDLAEQPQFRKVCWRCRQTSYTCYCEHVLPFDPQMKFVVLIHPLEVKRRIATGRMSHLCLERSELIEGEDYSDNKRVNEILASPELHPVVLYPGRHAVDISNEVPDYFLAFSADSPSSVRDISSLAEDQQSNDVLQPVLRGPRRLTIFVIDGTWNTARKTMHLSRNLRALPQICFTPTRPSNFQVRKQPAENCVSTLEAIHQTIELLGPACGFDINSRRHDRLLQTFARMVDKQLRFVRPQLNSGGSRHAKKKKISSLNPSVSP